MDINEAVEVYNDLMYLHDNGVWKDGVYPAWVSERYRLLLDMRVGSSQISYAAMEEVARTFHRTLVECGIIKPEA